ncbi:dipeptide ABC transporter ATP-binding protein [Pseudonocardia acaciae]|uniref:dipeptide ABC transporter ATP-binding protein n=1 Tax=Pseudonocardia acaciae TaxID=551276 RepID=UPI00048C8EB1|nr:ABC transporter ATP-binding protein [Pseudonocardia acaciae]
MAVVEVEGLTVVLEADGSPIVNDVSLSLEHGHAMGVVGESGSGKTTLALALLGYSRPGAKITGGRVTIDGTDLLSLSPAGLRQARRELVAYVPQDPAAALNPGLRIGTLLTEGLAGEPSEVANRVREILDTVGLPSDDAFLKRHPGQLSGGQQQRVAIAMAVAAGPRLIVLDEPTTGLDYSTQAKVLELVKRLCTSRDMAAVYVSHDLAVVGEVADQVTVMYGGRTVESGTRAQVLGSPAHPYSRALLDAVPSVRERLRLAPIPGRAPSVGQHGPGCVFAPRCGFVVQACRESEPELVPVPTGNQARCFRTSEVLARPRIAARDGGARLADMAGASSSLRAVRLNAGYGGRQVLFDASLDLAKGECLALVGESGSGKTTLSRCLIGLHEEVSGELRFDGEPLPLHADHRSDPARRGLQYVFQNPYGSLNPRRTVGASIEAPVRHFFGLGARETRSRAAEALERVELPAAIAGRYPAELSGGQRQRVAIARALVCDPEVLICDEVTSSLDVSVQAAVVELLRSLLADGLAMVFVTHNLAVVRSIADSVVVLSNGRVVEAGTADRVLTAPADDYTRSLLADTLEVPQPTPT